MNVTLAQSLSTIGQEPLKATTPFAKSFFTDQIHLKQKGVAATLYSASNHVFNKATPLLKGRSFERVSDSELLFQKDLKQKGWKRTALAIVLFVPCLLAGSVLRLAAFAIDSDMVAAHRKAAMGQFVYHKSSLVGKDVFTGPFGGKYNPNFFEAVNVNQKLDNNVNPEWIKKQKDSQRWEQMQKNYAAFCERVKKGDSNGTVQIEKNVHLIWVKPPNKAGRPLPDDAKKVYESWKEHHPESRGWNVKIWNDADLEPLVERVSKEFPNVKEVWDKASTAAERADIGRMVILWELGGLYVDSNDLPCFGPVDDLHAFSNGFYMSLESNDPPAQHNRTEGSFYIGNAQIGACKRDPRIGAVLKRARCVKPEELPPPGKTDFSIFERTGPTLYTRVLYEELQGEHKDEVLILPSSYFYAWDPAYKHNSMEFGLSQKLPWTKGIHLWAGKWNG